VCSGLGVKGCFILDLKYRVGNDQVNRCVGSRTYFNVLHDAVQVPTAGMFANQSVDQLDYSQFCLSMKGRLYAPSSQMLMSFSELTNKYSAHTNSLFMDVS
jgi:hypothetical protein